MPAEPDSISKCPLSLKGSPQVLAVNVHSAQFGGQVVLRPSPYHGDLDWCRSTDGANGCWQSVFPQLDLLCVPVQGQQLNLLLQLCLPCDRDGAGPEPLNTKRQVSHAGGLPPRQGCPCLQPPPEGLLLGGAHALQFAGQPGGLVLCVVGVVGRQEPFPAAAAGSVTRRRRGGGGRHRQRVGWRQGRLLLLLFDTRGRRRNLEGVVELGVVDSEEALLQGHDRKEAMTPQDFILSVRRPRLARHTCDGETRHQSQGTFEIQTRKWPKRRHDEQNCRERDIK